MAKAKRGSAAAKPIDALNSPSKIASKRRADKARAAVVAAALAFLLTVCVPHMLAGATFKNGIDLPLGDEAVVAVLNVDILPSFDILKIWREAAESLTPPDDDPLWDKVRCSTLTPVLAHAAGLPAHACCCLPRRRHTMLLRSPK
jgi:hypothetical protein